MAWPYTELLFDLLGGQDSLNNSSEIPQIPQQTEIGTLDPRIPVRFPTAQDVWSPSDRADIATRPGNSDVRAAAINAAGVGTGMLDQGAIAARFLLTVSIVAGSHQPYEDVANPPTVIAGGTNLTIGQDNLTTLLNFTDGANRGTIILSRLRDLPQFINAAGTRSNFTVAGTGLSSLLPGFGEIFGQRALYADYDQDGTVHKNRLAYTDLRDGNLITDITVQFESFERRELDDQVRGMRRLSDFCIVGGRDYIELLGLTPTFERPFGRQEVAGGIGKGPLSHRGMIVCDQRCVWNSASGIISLEGSQGEVLKDWTTHIKPYYTGSLDQDRLRFCAAGYDPKTDIGCWAVSETGQTTHNKVIAINFKRGEIYIWTLSRNAFANRIVSGEHRLIGMGYVGLFRNEIQTAVFTGNADDASAAIDADIFTPRHHCQLPGIKKLFAGIKIWFDQQGTSEAVTVQYRLDDASAWSSFSASPYTVAGTAGDVDPEFFPLMKAGKNLQVRFRDAISGQAFRILKYALLFKILEPGLV